MSIKRTSRPPYAGQKGRCAWCGTHDIPKIRRSWCSDACVEAYKMRSHPEFVRQKLYERDRGICALCGCDADQEYRKWLKVWRELAELAGGLRRLEPFRGRSVSYSEERKCRERMVAKYIPKSWTHNRKSGWDADHIIPVAEGGGECDLSNYRTLCHPCHKAETAKLAARLAARRKIENGAMVNKLFEGEYA